MLQIFILEVVTSMKPYGDPWRQGCRLFRTRRSLSNTSFSFQFIFVFLFSLFFVLFFLFWLPFFRFSKMYYFFVLFSYHGVSCSCCTSVSDPYFVNQQPFCRAHSWRDLSPATVIMPEHHDDLLVLLAFLWTMKTTADETVLLVLL